MSYIFVALSQQITSTKRTVKYSVFDFTQNTFPGASTQTPFEIICTISVMQCYKDDTCKSLEPPTGKHQTSNISTSLSHWNGKIALPNLNLLSSHLYSMHFEKSLILNLLYGSNDGTSTDAEKCQESNQPIILLSVF